ncbi:MAG: dihydrodipicolinate synthase family protein [Desulfurococcales archaeon]|nr:dihydrodipicolinate synthase family protein [Desulfurococcales archaeon]
MNIRGIIVPMITPFQEDYSLDVDGVKWLVEFLENNGVHGLFPASTTGEFVHLSREERDSLVSMVVDHHKRALVLPGVSANSTLEAVEFGRKYVDMGVDGVIATPPYYFKPRKEGLFRHFGTLAEKIDAPVIIYNIPSLTGNLLTVDLLSDLIKEYSNLVGIKITYSDFTYLRRAVIELKEVNPSFSILTGIGDMLLPNLMAGGDGGVVALANFDPKLLVGLYETYVSGNLDAAVSLWRRVLELSEVYDIAETPVVIKEALHLIKDVIKPITRPPLLPLDEARRRVLVEKLSRLGLLEEKP